MSKYGRGVYGAGFYGVGSNLTYGRSVAVIPGANEDEVWLIVKRYINGEWVSYLEQMQPRNYGGIEDAWFVDCALSYSGPPATVFSGLDHLEGETVAVLADALVQTTKTVSSGSVTIDTAASRVIIGLPYRYSLKPMRFDLFTQQGTSKGSIKRFAEAVISFFESTGAKYGVDPDNLFDIDWPTTGLYTGDKVVAHEGGFDVEDSIIITGDDPMPCTVRAIIPKIKWTGR